MNQHAPWERAVPAADDELQRLKKQLVEAKEENLKLQHTTLRQSAHILHLERERTGEGDCKFGAAPSPYETGDDDARLLDMGRELATCHGALVKMRVEKNATDKENESLKSQLVSTKTNAEDLSTKVDELT